jgi:hypothetical protein
VKLLEPGQKVFTEDVFRVDQDEYLIVPAEQVAELLVLLDCLVMALEGALQAGGNGEVGNIVALCPASSAISLPWP